MFVVSATTHGINQKLLAFVRISDALARASISTPTVADKAQIYRVADASDSLAAVSAVGIGKGAYVDAVAQTSAETLGADRAYETVKTQILVAMTPALLDRSAG
ncbi:MAG: hypothetical protein CTY15_13915 [Methylocystis sp.]|nr:MAG: hypothetical protein CTY15_13915 [Methylocystis sp.]